MTEFQNLSENELQAVIVNAEKALKAKQAHKRKEIMNQIRELAASINVTVEIIEGEKSSARKGVKVPVKYRHPNDPSQTWTGRGVMPKWLQTFVEQGHDRSEFEIN